MPSTTTEPTALDNLRALPRFVTGGIIAHAFVAWVFAVTGPLLILLSASRMGHLTEAQVSSWILVGYGLGGVMGIVLSLRYRQPIVTAWSIPGAILVGGFLSHHTLEEAAGVYFLTGALVLVVGLSGVMKRVTEAIPMPIILGMVAGILLPLGSRVVDSVVASPVVAGTALGCFFVAHAVKRGIKRIPPVFWAMLGGGLMALKEGGTAWDSVQFGWGVPALIVPTFSPSALAELLVPLALTMVAVQNAQTGAILKGLGYTPPINPVTVSTGAFSMVGAFFGSHSTCTAPVMVGIAGSPEAGPLEGRYSAGVINGLMLIAFALLAPVMASLGSVLPAPLVNVLGGLALVPVLAASLGQAFGGTHRMGALFSFLITVSNVTLFRVGAPFWGMVGGLIASVILDAADFKKKTPSNNG